MMKTCNDLLSLDLMNIGGIQDVDADEYWSPAELRAAIGRRRSELESCGIAAGDRVVIAHGGSPGFFVDLFATWSLGACAACINTSATTRELDNLIAFTEPKQVLKNPLVKASGSELDKLELVSDDPALILFTSGTTGEPKGVVHSFESVIARVTQNANYISDASLVRTLCILPTHFGHGLIGNGLTPLLNGGELILAPGGGVQRAAALGALIDQYRVSFMSSVPSFWKMVLKLSPPPGANHLRQVSVGSAPVSADLVHQIIEWSGTDDVRNMYGITETANWAAGSSASERSPEDGLVGAMWGGEAAVLSEGKIASEGSGELLLKTPSMMTGYYQRPDLTEEVMMDGWYRTGDLGQIDAAGVIRLTGRLKHEINRAGMKISPEEVDLLLEKHPLVAEVCAFGLADDLAGEIVAVAIRLEEDQPGADKLLREYCLEQIRRECVPERWFFLEEIPRTDRGKLNRDQVRETCLTQ